MVQHSGKLKSKPLEKQDHKLENIDLSSLNHECVSQALSEFNKELVLQMNQQEVQEAQLQSLISNRAQEVERLLNSLEQDDKKQFAYLETKTNDFILARLSELKDIVKEDLGKVSRASKAIKKYNKA